MVEFQPEQFAKQGRTFLGLGFCKEVLKQGRVALLPGRFETLADRVQTPQLLGGK
jgi:hypothetical protein